MKKVFISLGIILVIAGIVIVGVYGGAKGFTDWRDLRLHELSKADEVVEFAASDLQDMRKIEIDADQFCVYVVESSDAEKVSVKYVSDLPNGAKVDVTYDNKTLKVTQTMKHTDHWFEKVWNLEYFNYFIVIEIPKTDAFADVKVNAELRNGALFVDSLDLSYDTHHTYEGD